MLAGTMFMPCVASFRLRGVHALGGTWAALCITTGCLLSFGAKHGSNGGGACEPRSHEIWSHALVLTSAGGE